MELVLSSVSSGLDQMKFRFLQILERFLLRLGVLFNRAQEAVDYIVTEIHEQTEAIVEWFNIGPVISFWCGCIILYLLMPEKLKHVVYIVVLAYFLVLNGL